MQGVIIIIRDNGRDSRQPRAKSLSDKRKEKIKRRRGVELPSFVPVIAPRNKLYPIGVLALLAPEPEVSTRITPD